MSRSALSPRATYFYPRPPCGGRQLLVCTTINQRLFLSTPSVRRATGAGAGAAHVVADFYPRPPCGGRRHKSAGTVGHIWISIHALRAEGDRTASQDLKKLEVFLSTPSVRRATDVFTKMPPPGTRFLSTPSVRRATPWQSSQIGSRFISIHALRAEGDA